MGLFDGFPFSNLHELNLDWIIAKLKDVDKVKEAAENVEENVERAVNSAASAEESARNANGSALLANSSLAQVTTLRNETVENREECERILQDITDIPYGRLSLLWRNASPASGMSSGTRISLPLASKNCYAFVLVATYNNTTITHKTSTVCFRDVGRGFFYFPVCKTGSTVYAETARGFVGPGTGGYDIFQFWNSYVNGQESLVINCIPYEIYGLARGDL